MRSVQGREAREWRPTPGPTMAGPMELAERAAGPLQAPAASTRRDVIPCRHPGEPRTRAPAKCRRSCGTVLLESNGADDGTRAHVIRIVFNTSETAPGDFCALGRSRKPTGTVLRQLLRRIRENDLFIVAKHRFQLWRALRDRERTAAWRLERSHVMAEAILVAHHIHGYGATCKCMNEPATVGGGQERCGTQGA